MKEISLEERKRIQLDMLDEIDTFCKNHSIRYSLAFGTLLGAIRHKGFIPWDDDVDIMMPLPDLLKFKNEFYSEKLEYCDIDNTKNYEMPFSRICYKPTYSRLRKFAKTYGICIDLYIVVGIPPKEEQDIYFENAQKLQNIRKRFMYINDRLFKYWPYNTSLYGFEKAISRYRDYYFNTCNYDSSSFFYIIAGPLSLRNKMIYEKDIFTKCIEVEFEGRFYPSISDYDYFLRLRYGNYMQLPPEGERHPYHGRKNFWK